VTRDWHAAYLTDPGVMIAARQRATETGEDGWAAAATLAPTMPPTSFASYDSFGAREILAPGAVPTEGEMKHLDDAARYGCYVDPNLNEHNHDLVGSMTRPADPGRKIRPDLDCPGCCEKAGQPEETGAQLQEYRCPQCGELWKYIPPVDSDERYSSDRYAIGNWYEQERAATPSAVVCPTCFGGTYPDVQVDVTYECPACGHLWLCTLRGGPMSVVAPEAFAQQVADAFDVPGELLGIDQARWTAHWHPATHPFPFEPPETEQDVAEREAREQTELRSALERAARDVLVSLMHLYPGMEQARQQRLVTVDPPGGLGPDGRVTFPRVRLTPLGRVRLRQLRRQRV
jgi:hypothetical protein